MSIESILILLLGTPQVVLAVMLTLHMRKQNRKLKEVIRIERGLIEASDVD